MRKTSAIAIMAVLFSACEKEARLAPPAGARVLSFERNTHIRNRFIYQAQAEGSFRQGDAPHLYWAGVTGGTPSHRLHVQLLGNIQEIYFTLHFPSTKKKIICAPTKDKNIAGCAVPVLELMEREFVVEVLGPRGMKLNKIPEYRLFMGIEGDKPLEFHAPAK